MTGTTGYWILATSTTAVQSVYTWSGSAWTSIGTIPPQVGTTDQMRYATVNNHVTHWNGASWDDLGVVTINFGPCTNPDTGCPTANYAGINSGPASNIPQCDPLIVEGGAVVRGGCSGTVTKWSGTTRAISAEPLTITDRIVITPAGAFSQNDWALAMQAGFFTRGGLDSAGSVDPANTNLMVGVNCLSFKDDWSRSAINGFQINNTTNSVVYNSRVKLYAMDGYDFYSTHRVWSINNYVSDPTQTWNHMDAVQIGIFSGTSTTKYYYGNAIVDNEEL